MRILPPYLHELSISSHLVKAAGLIGAADRSELTELLSTYERGSFVAFESMDSDGRELSGVGSIEMLEVTVGDGKAAFRISIVPGSPE